MSGIMLPAPSAGSAHYPLCGFDLHAAHARTLLPAALASVSFGFVLVISINVSSSSGMRLTRFYVLPCYMSHVTCQIC